MSSNGNVLIGALIFTLVISGSAFVFMGIHESLDKVQARSNIKAAMEAFRSNLEEVLILNDGAFRQTIEGNDADIFGCIALLRNPKECFSGADATNAKGASAIPIKVFDGQGDVYFDSLDSTQGITFLGEPCLGYSNVAATASTACPIRALVQVRLLTNPLNDVSPPDCYTGIGANQGVTGECRCPGWLFEVTFEYTAPAGKQAFGITTGADGLSKNSYRLTRNSLGSYACPR